MIRKYDGKIKTELPQLTIYSYDQLYLLSFIRYNEIISKTIIYFVDINLHENRS